MSLPEINGHDIHLLWHRARPERTTTRNHPHPANVHAPWNAATPPSPPQTPRRLDLQQPAHDPARAQAHHHHRFQQQEYRPYPTHLEMLQQLRRDEAHLAQCKKNIALFGAGWLLPPGFRKTYQEMMDEKVEREEQERLALLEEERRRVQEVAELAAAVARQEADAAAAAFADLDADQEVQMVEDGERDLDDEIPEAEEDADLEFTNELADDGDEIENERVRQEEIATEEMVMMMLDGEGGVRAAHEDASGVEADAEVEVEVAVEAADVVDLDQDVPEAGSYQHTDTEEDDDEDAHEHEAADGIITPDHAAPPQQPATAALRTPTNATTTAVATAPPSATIISPPSHPYMTRARRTNANVDLDLGLDGSITSSPSPSRTRTRTRARAQTQTQTQTQTRAGRRGVGGDAHGDGNGTD
ncbi:MAG: hypothetical protein M1826_000257 [Phylliscum demangeonii]|nr:MAG: hypothetical protein M1826_000257 [Phylliscum demangeonii]